MRFIRLKYTILIASLIIFQNCASFSTIQTTCDEKCPIGIICATVGVPAIELKVQNYSGSTILLDEIIISTPEGKRISMNKEMKPFFREKNGFFCSFDNEGKYLIDCSFHNDYSENQIGIYEISIRIGTAKKDIKIEVKGHPTKGKRVYLNCTEPNECDNKDRQSKAIESAAPCQTITSKILFQYDKTNGWNRIL